MENLKSFLEARRKKPPSDGNSWDSLSRKLDQIKQEEQTKKKPVLKVNWIESDTSSVTDVISCCINTINVISSKCESPFALIPASSKNICNNLVEDLAHLNSSGHLCKHDFTQSLLKIKHPLPLELIWMLYRIGMLQISTYIFRKVQTDEETFLSSCVLWLLQNSRKSPVNVQIVTDVFASALVASNHSGTLNPHLSTVCAAFWRRCTEEIVDWVYSSSCMAESESNSSSIEFAYLSSANLIAACGEKAVENLAFTYLHHLLNIQSEQNNIQAVSCAVEMQEKVSLENVSLSLKSLLVSVAKTLGGLKVINKLRTAVVGPMVNWRTVFLLTAVLIAEHPESWDLLKALTDELIQVGLEQGRKTELSAGLLLARQCCNCDSKIFSTYSIWFSSQFGPNSVTARSTLQYCSLLQLLTDIVPVESAEMLRIHINKVPQAPTSCHTILHDYTVLARTRLADLNESSELAGLFSDSKEDSLPGLDSRQRDLVKVLLHFQQTQEVMKPVLEASMFRRLYYRNVFLVELLGLPGSASGTLKVDEFGVTREIRHEFIQALRSLGKIPDKLFKSYVDLRSEQALVANKEPSCSKEISMETKSESSGVFNKKKSLQVRQKKK